MSPSVSSMELELTPVRRRMLAVAILVLPPAIFVALLISAISGWIEHDRQIGAITRETMTYERLIADLPKRQASIAAINASGAKAALFPNQPLPAVASQIETRVKAALASSGATPTQLSTEVKAETESPVVRVESQAMFSCDIAALTRVLHALEENQPSLFVEKLSVGDLGVSLGGDNSLPGPHRLDVQLTISGYMAAK